MKKDKFCVFDSNKRKESSQMRRKSFEMQYLETLQGRTSLNEHEKQQLVACQKGYKGELQVDELIERITKNQYPILDNVDLIFDKQRIQVDKLLQIGNKLYLIDIKNYHGHYVFRDRTWYCNGKPLTHSIFGQIDRTHDILARIFAENHVNIEIIKVLVFTDHEAVLDIQEETGVVVKYLWDFCGWVQMLCSQSAQNVQIRWQEYLQPYMVTFYRPDNDFSTETDRKLTKGIKCPNCGGFELQQHRYYLRCQCCEYCQPKETAYVRTICEYGVLFFKENLRISDLINFLGERYSSSYLEKILMKHFNSLKFKSKQFCYENKGIEFQYWFGGYKNYFEKIQDRVHWGS